MRWKTAVLIGVVVCCLGQMNLAVAQTSGATLYATDCAGCHGALASSGVKGTTAALIQTGITNNMGGMGSLSTLTTADIHAIAAALNPTPTPTPPSASQPCDLFRVTI